MAKKSSQSLLSSYRRKRRPKSKAPLLILMGLLVVAGLALVLLWGMGRLGTPAWQVFATETPTPTLTHTPTLTPIPNTPTYTPTITETPTLAPTATPDQPYPYVVLPDEFCATIAEKFDVELEALVAVNMENYGADCLIHVGDTILIPPAWMQMATSTPIPTELAAGTVLDYYVESGATLRSVAAWFRSTVERIILETNRYNSANGLAAITEDTQLLIGQLLKVPVNVAPPPTATVTLTRTSTPAP